MSHHLLQVGSSFVVDGDFFSLPLPQLLAVSAVLGVDNQLHLKLGPQHGLRQGFLVVTDGFDLHLKHT